MLVGLIFAVGGFVVLAAAADILVSRTARIAIHYRVSSVVVGAVLIGFGTSAPEMVISGLAAAEGELGIGVGNIVGSNVANISLVLAAAAIVRPVPIDDVTLRRQLPISVAAVTVLALAVQGDIKRWEGIVLALLIVWFVVYTLRTPRIEALDAQVAGRISLASGRPGIDFMGAAVGLVGVVLSSWFIVNGASRVADVLDLSGGFVGFTLVAIGTSAPELITSVQAARQGETDLVVGNLLGSNVFNSLAVGGIIGIVGPGTVEDTRLVGTGSVLMVAIVVVSAVFMIHRKEVGLAKGFILLGLWVGSVVMLSGSGVG